MTAYVFPDGYFGLPTGEQLNSLASVQTFSMPLTLAQMTSLFTDPITLLPPPGEGFAYVIMSSCYQNVHGTGSFTSTDSGPGLYYGLPSLQSGNNVADGGAGVSPFVPEDVIIQPPILPVIDNFGGFQSTTSWIDNAPIVLANVSANMTGGAGSHGRITILYYVIAV